MLSGIYFVSETFSACFIFYTQYLLTKNVREIREKHYSYIMEEVGRKYAFRISFAIFLLGQHDTVLDNYVIHREAYI